MKNVQKLFVASALSLAVAGAYAAGSDCDSLNDVNSMSYWASPAMLAECVLGQDAPAAGGTETPDVDNLQVGRHDSNAFDPELNGSDDTELHIALPDIEEGQFFGYYAGEDYSYSYNEGEGESEEVTSQQVGSVLWGVEDGYSYNEGYGYGGYGGYGYGGYGYGEDLIELESFDADGNPVVDRSYSSDGYGSGYGNSYAQVWLDGSPDSNGSAYGEGYEESENGYTYHGVYAMEATVVSGDDEEEQSTQVLKDYWVGLFGYSKYVWDEETQTQTSTGSYNVFVAGALTPLSDIQALVSGDVSAVYTGNSHLNDQSVILNINFGTGEFGAEVGDMNTDAKENAGIAEAQNMGFTASGVINGQHFVSTTISADAGFIQGSLFGANANIAGGAYDVTIDGNRVVDAFTAVQGEGNHIVNGGIPR